MILDQDKPNVIRVYRDNGRYSALLWSNGQAWCLSYDCRRDAMTKAETWQELFGYRIEDETLCEVPDANFLAIS